MKQNLNLRQAMALIAVEQYKIEKQKLAQFDIDATKPGGISIIALANQIKATKDANLKAIAAVNAISPAEPADDDLDWNVSDEGTPREG
jgi:hypothetical protein